MVKITLTATSATTGERLSETSGTHMNKLSLGPQANK